MKNHESRLHCAKVYWGYVYRDIYYKVTVPYEADPYLIYRAKEGHEIQRLFCAYFYLHTSKLKLGMKFENRDKSRYEGGSDFLNSKIIDELNYVAHCGFTFAEWNSRVDGNLITEGVVKLGVDYNHACDETASHTLKSVCSDCEVVIDKLHELGSFRDGV